MKLHTCTKQKKYKTKTPISLCINTITVANFCLQVSPVRQNLLVLL